VTVVVELDDSTKQIIINADMRYKDLCKTLPGAGYNVKDRLWRLPVSYTACLSLRSTFREQLEIGPGLWAWAQDEKNQRIDPSNLIREALDFPGGDEDLFPHQRAGVEFLTTARRALLADEPGLGKTAQAIRSLRKLHNDGENVFPILIVCPNTLKSNWQREFDQWWPGLNIQVIRGTAVQRRKQFAPFIEPIEDEPVAEVLIMNWESLRFHSSLAPYGSIALKKCVAHGGLDEKVTESQCEKHPGELNKIDFKAVVADEIHRSKDPKSKQTRALWAATGDADIRFAMTGTPIARDVIDLWSILHWLDPLEYPSKTRWIDRMVDVMMNTFGGMVAMGVKAEMSTEFYASVNPRMRRMLKAVVLPNLPEIMHERRDTEMSAKQKKAYGQMRDSMIAELEDGTYMTAPSSLTQTQRLLQFASSFAYVDVDEDTGAVKTTLTEPSSKIDALIDDMKHGDFGDDSIAVSAVSSQLINLLSARLTKESIPHGLVTGDVSEELRQHAVANFQAGRTKWILFTAQAGGVGITLTAARRLIRLQRPWSLVDDKQVNDRVHRIGSEVHDSIIIMDYMTDNTIEDRVVQVLDSKGGNFEEVVRDKDQLLKLLKDDKGAK